MIHGLSLGIGAMIASVTIIAVFLGFDGILNEPKLILEPEPGTGGNESQKITAATFLNNGSPVLGDPDAPITMVEFGDYQCHFCNVFFHDTENQILEEYVNTGKVKMIFKDYNIIGPDSINASHGAHCADDQGAFWQYHDILYSNWTGENNGWASSENLLKFAQQADMDVDQWSECMADGLHSKTVVASNEDAKSLELGGTPAFFIIGPDGETTPIFGAQPFESFEEIFEIELEKLRSVDG